MTACWRSPASCSSSPTHPFCRRSTRAASTLALANSRYCTPVLQLQHVGDAAVVITEPDSGLALTEYMKRSSSSFLSYVAIRSIVGQCTQAVQELLDTGLTHTAPEHPIPFA